MLRNKLTILALTAIILAVFASGNAFAYSYQTQVHSKLVETSQSPSVAHAEWYAPAPTDNENMNMNKYNPDYTLTCQNSFTNTAPHITTNLMWWGQGYNGNGILAQSYYYDFQSAGITSGQTRTYTESVMVDKSKPTGQYGYDEAHTYYPSNSPWYNYAYSPSQMARKYITLTT